MWFVSDDTSDNWIKAFPSFLPPLCSRRRWLVLGGSDRCCCSARRFATTCTSKRAHHSRKRGRHRLKVTSIDIRWVRFWFLCCLVSKRVWRCVMVVAVWVWIEHLCVHMREVLDVTTHSPSGEYRHNSPVISCFFPFVCTTHRPTQCMLFVERVWSEYLLYSNRMAHRILELHALLHNRNQSAW